MKQKTFSLSQSPETINVFVFSAHRNRLSASPQNNANDDSTRPPKTKRKCNNVPRPCNNHSKKASSVYAQLKDSRFSVDITKSFELTVRDYDVCACQHGPTFTKKADLFINVFTEPAHTYFFIKANDSVTLDDIVEIMEVEYDSSERRDKVLAQVQSLSLEKQVKDEEISDKHEGLTAMVNLNHKFMPQCPYEFLLETHKIRHLFTAVFDFSWWQMLQSNVMPLKYSFNQLVTALHAQIDLKKEEQVLENGRTGQSTTSNVMFRQYAQNRKHLSKRKCKGNSPLESEERFKHGHHPWKYRQKCQPGTIRRNFSKRLHNRAYAVQIMSRLIQSMKDNMHAGDEKHYHEEEATASDEVYYINSLTNAHEEDDETNKVEEAYHIYHL